MTDINEAAKRHKRLVKDVVTPLAQDCLDALGTGRPEVVYGNALAIEMQDLCGLNHDQFRYDREYRIAAKYKGHEVSYGFADFVLWATASVTTAFIIELKQGLELGRENDKNRSAKRQIRQYMRDLREATAVNAVFGVLLNFPLADEKPIVQAETLT